MPGRHGELGGRHHLERLDQHQRAVGANWDGGIAPGAADVAIIGSSPQSPDFRANRSPGGGCEPTFRNNIGDTGGGGVLNLVGADNEQFFSEGDQHHSTIAFDIVATKNIQTNGTHSVTFNGRRHRPQRSKPSAARSPPSTASSPRPTSS